MLELNKIDFQYGKTPVLCHFSMTVQQGEVLAIKGPSGSGKSTILRLIAGLEKVKKGDILLNGKSITNLPSYQRNVGYVFQDFALFPNMKVKNNIRFGISYLKKNEQEVLVNTYAKMLEIESLLDRYPHELSGGQRQRVALARTLVTKLDILLLDEPFSALDQDLKVSVRFSLSKLLKDLHLTTILVTHDMEDANALATRIISL